MDDTTFGVRTRRGAWTPNRRITYPPVFVWPPRPAGLAKWLLGFPGYLWPWNLFYIGLSLAAWWLTTPSKTAMASFGAGWIAVIAVRNAALMLLVFGTLHLRLYIRRSQGTQSKFNERWPAENSPRFAFANQTKDNLLWGFASGLPIWTAYEVITLWMFANGHLAWLDLRDNPVWFVALFLLIPLFREVHFYAVHRLIHLPALYKPIHSLHHRNTNPGPWSGLSMHPAEHLLYFTGVFLHWIVPSHPVHAIFHLMHAGLTPAMGHAGFEKVEFADGRTFDTNSFAHYLHHKYFEVNYADGSIPLDRWFGSFHDGSPEADARMQARRLANRAASADFTRAEQGES